MQFSYISVPLSVVFIIRKQRTHLNIIVIISHTLEEKKTIDIFK